MPGLKQEDDAQEGQNESPSSGFSIDFKRSRMNSQDWPLHSNSYSCGVHPQGISLTVGHSQEGTNANHTIAYLP